MAFIKKYGIHFSIIVVMTGLLLGGYWWRDRDPQLGTKSLRAAPHSRGFEGEGIGGFAC